MSKLYTTIFFLFFSLYLNSQSLDFQNAIYYTALGNALTSSEQTLDGFNYYTASSDHPLFKNGIYFPIKDYQDKNLWVRVRHIASDPNGPSVGVNVPSTCGDPFRAGFGGWGGFLYQFDIYKDAIYSGIPSNVIDALYPSNISVESIETLSEGEIVLFELLNLESTVWSLNSINFTGNNPTSTPGFSSSTNYWTGNQPPSGFTTTFPAASKKVNVVDYGSGRYYAEFKMSAENVSSFSYGYEFNQLCYGYQGMRMSFGIKSVTPLKLLSFNGVHKNKTNQLNWVTTNEENTYVFFIERSKDGIHFNRIGQVPANNLPGENNYLYEDKSIIFEESVYYRLKQVDKDGKFTFSNILNVSSPKESFSLLASVNNQKITVISQEQDGMLKIVNANGQTLINQKMIVSTTTINISQWPSGLYLVHYLTKAGQQTKKIVIAPR